MRSDPQVSTAPFAGVAAGRNATTFASRPASPPTVPAGSMLPSTATPSGELGSAARIALNAATYDGVSAASGAGARTRASSVGTLAASAAAYCASAARPGSSAGSGVATSSTIVAIGACCCNAATSAGSGAVAPAGHVTVTRVRCRPACTASAACDGSVSAAPTRSDGAGASVVSSLDCVVRFGTVEAARTIGSASNDAWLPAESVAVT